MLDFNRTRLRGDEGLEMPEISLSGWSVNGVPASGWVDLDHLGSTDAVGCLCVQRGQGCTPVIGQVLCVEGPIRFGGQVRHTRSEFRVTEAWDCEDGRCVHVTRFPLNFRDHSWIPIRDHL